MSNYACTVVRVGQILTHPNADRLERTLVFGNPVIFGKGNFEEGDLALFFPAESQLGEKYCQANDLIRRKDESGKSVGGMLEENRRVRTIKLRGQPSAGLLMPVESLDFLGKYNVKEGDEFEEMDGVQIATKYIPKKSNPSKNGPKKGRQAPRESKIIPGQFRFHTDTSQLGKNLHKINPKDLLVLTWKMHGTSAIASNCLVKRKLTWYEKLLLWVNIQIVQTVYDMIYASRRVIKNEFQETKDHFYGYDLWTEVGQEHFAGKLQSGETVYYEVVGYKKDGGYIQAPFDYGCAIGEHKVYVYRITKTGFDGNVVELSWPQVVQRCLDMGVETVPVIFIGRANEILETDHEEMTIEQWRDAFLQELKENFVYDQDSRFCKNEVPEEGICVRKEGADFEVLKLKAFLFLEYETKQLDAGTVDIETQQTEIQEAA
jgi:hypothetical protein